MRAPLSSSARNEQLRSQAIREFADHRLLGECYWEEGRGARWLIGKPTRVEFRSEIFAGSFGSLLVHGDIDTCRFAHYGDHGDVWNRLLWMADCTDLGYYVRQKASIGMAGSAEAYDEDVALYDLRRARLERTEDGRACDELIGLLTDAEKHVDEKHELRGFLSSNDRGWDLWKLEIGRILAPRVVFAHAALVRTAGLLREKYGPDGPPAARVAEAAQ